MIDIFSLYEDLKKYTSLNFDSIFYDAPEGEVQLDILKDMLMEIYTKI